MRPAALCLLLAFVSIPARAQDAPAAEREEAATEAVDSEAASAVDPPPSIDDELPPEVGYERPLDQQVEPEGPWQPPRLLATLGGGGALRVIRHRDFQQEWFGAYLDAMGAYVFGTSAKWRHGVGLGISTNLSSDGAGQVATGAQWVLAPAYLAYFRFGEDLVLTGKASALFSLSPDFTLGGELALGATFLFTAGLGAYVEAGAALYVGAANQVGGLPTWHPITSAEIGITIDYEVLP